MNATRKRKFFIATEEEIISGETTDVYFLRAVETLNKVGKNPEVKMEIHTSSLPKGWEWGVFSGLKEVLSLLEGKPITLWALEEGEIFKPDEPVMIVETNYADFAPFETPLLGLICQSSGISTKALRLKIAAGGKPVLSFGVRRMHPAIAPMIDRASYIGGADGIASVLSAKLMNKKPVGTMPHAMILIIGDTVKAAVAFNEAVPPEVPRIALIDTFGDEKFEAIRVAETLKEKLYGVRLDTPASRRGNLKKILEEIRWELDLRGYGYVKLIVSGGLDEKELEELKDIADSFGVGTSLSNSPVINFAMDIVEIEGKPITKKGKKSGAKQLWVCPTCGYREVSLLKPEEEAHLHCPYCGSEMEPKLKKFIENGKTVREPRSEDEARKNALRWAGWKEE